MLSSDFADEFLKADVVGTDITPIQPCWVPANVKFELDDCNLEWTWPDNTFDFVHGRMLIGIIEDWYEFHRQAFRTCKPGGTYPRTPSIHLLSIDSHSQNSHAGYVETFVASTSFHCDDGTVKEDSAMSQWGKVWREGGRKLGRTFEAYENDLQRKAMEAAGFVDIEYKDYFVPMGGWGDDKEAAEKGLWCKITVEADLEGELPFARAASTQFASRTLSLTMSDLTGLMLIFFAGYTNYIFNVIVGWTPEETNAYTDQLKKEWSNPNIHGYFWARSAWGRKP